MIRRLVCILGVALILASLGLMGWMEFHNREVTATCAEVSEKLTQMLPGRNPGMVGSGDPMPALQIGGRDYAALLEAPDYGLALPVADRWNGGNGVPARFCGSVYDGSLVIGGSESQLGFCNQIHLGAYITITDMTGATFSYRVCQVDRAQKAPSHWLTEGDWDLTIFFRGTYSTEYLAVRCQGAYR